MCRIPFVINKQMNMDGEIYNFICIKKMKINPRFASLAQ